MGALLFTAGGSPAHAAEQAPAPVEVRTIERLTQCLCGPRAESKLGDYLIQADGLRIAFSAISNRTLDPLRVSGGMLIDVNRPDSPLDYFEGLGPAYNPQGVYSYQIEKIEILADQSAPESDRGLRITGRDNQNRDLTFTTSYQIDPRAYLMTLVTELQNGSDQAVENLELGDQIYWGFLSVFVNGRGWLNPQLETETRSTWLAGQTDNMTIGLFTAETDFAATHKDYITRTVYRKLERLEPGAKVEYKRYLRFGDANLGLTSNEVNHRRQGGIGELLGRVVSPPSGGVAGAKVFLARAPDEKIPQFEPETIVHTDAQGFFRARVPGGAYLIRIESAGRPTYQFPSALTLLPNETRYEVFNLGAQSGLQYEVTEKGSSRELPCKLALLGVGNTPTPMLGPAHQMPSAYNFHFSATGRGVLQLPPGEYELTILRGIEYKPRHFSFRVPAGELHSISAELERVIDTSGYISLELGVKTNATYGCFLDAEQRVITALAEGVEMLISGDHNRVTDLTPTIDRLGAGGWLRAVPGMRIVPQQKGTMGEYQVFPVAPGFTTQPPLDQQILQLGYDSFAITRLLRERFPESLIALGLALDADRGYFTPLKYKPFENLNFPPRPELISYDFDLLEVFRGRDFGANTGMEKLAYDLRVRVPFKPYYGISDGNTAVFGELGYPRIFVASSTDQPAAVDPAEIIANLKRGNFQLSNGPFIEPLINGSGPGELISARKDQRYHLSFKVLAPEFAEINSIAVFFNGTMEKTFFRGGAPTELKFPLPESDPAEIPLRIKRDTIVTVRASGNQRIYPAASDTLNGWGAAPFGYFAVSCPLHVDADGDGEFNPALPMTIDEMRLRAATQISR